MTDLWQLDAATIADGVNRKAFSALDVVNAQLSRMDAVNPAFNAVVQTMPEEALEAAHKIDQQIANGKSAGILAGVPVTIKVNIDQAGYANTNGLKLLKDNIAKTDNPVVTNLRDAGAIIVGRTNTPAFSMRWFTNNQLHGHTLNPRNTGLTPGGSSGGAAAAVACGIGAIGHGTDIAGSVRYPAYACGLQGLRPTIGRIPAVNLSLPDRHICPQITAVSGPITRSVRDLELAFRAMSTRSALDPWWVPAPHTGPAFNKTATLCTHPDGMNTSSVLVEALHQSASILRENGWTVTESACPPLREPMELQLKFWMAEFQLDQGAMIEKENDPDACFVYDQLRSMCDTLEIKDFMHIMQSRLTITRAWQEFFETSPLLLCPVSAELPFEDQRDTRSAEDFRQIIEAQMPQIGLPLVGIPAASICTGTSNSSPIGVQLVSGRYREDILFEAARLIEANSPPIAISNPE